MNVTIKDVANEAGVSISTVSKIINGKGSISQDTINRVQETIKRLNYTPNSRAVSFAKQNTKNIIFLTSMKKNEPYLNPHMFEIMDGSYSALSGLDYTLSLMDISMKDRQESPVIQAIQSGCADGILVHGSAVTEETAKYIIDSNFPHVIIGSPSMDNQLCWIDTNHVLAGQCAAEHLLECRYTNIVFIGEKRTDFISNQRLKGVKKAFINHGLHLEAENIYSISSNISNARSLTKEILTDNPKIQAIICENNTIAFGVSAGILDLKLDVPNDIAFITFDSYPYANIIEPKPTVVDIDMFDLGFQAAQTLIRKIDNPLLLAQGYSTLPILKQGLTTKKGL